MTLTINPFQDFKKGVIAARVLLDCDVAVLHLAGVVIATSVS